MQDGFEAKIDEIMLLLFGWMPRTSRGG
jgi:hypothetical protein